MKFQAALALYLAQNAFAEEISTPAPRSLKMIKSMLTDLSCAAGSCVDSKEYQKVLRDYGCNCFSNNPNMEWDGVAVFHFVSRGEPVDEVDNACKEAFKRYKCLEADFSSGLLTDNSSCSAGMFFEYHISSDNELICGPPSDPNYSSDLSANGCKAAACEIEKAFSMRVYNEIGNEMNNSGKKLKFQDSNKNNYALECTARPGPARDACCGTYPDRKPYSSDLQSCCDNGNVRSFGSC